MPDPDSLTHAYDRYNNRVVCGEPIETARLAQATRDTNCAFCAYWLYREEVFTRQEWLDISVL